MANHTNTDRKSLILTEKQRVFALEYIANGGNGTRAAMVAGFGTKNDPKYCSVMACKVLKRKHVKAFIEFYTKPHELTPTRVLKEMAGIALHMDMADFEPLLKGEKTLEELRADGVDTRNVSQIKISRRVGEGEIPYEDVTIKLQDRSAMISKLGKILGLEREPDETDESGQRKILNVTVNLEPVKRLSSGSHEIVPGLPAPNIFPPPQLPILDQEPCQYSQQDE